MDISKYQLGQFLKRMNSTAVGHCTRIYTGSNNQAENTNYSTKYMKSSSYFGV